MVMLVLALDSALARCSAAVVVDGELRATRQNDAGRGYADLLPGMAAAVLAEAAVAATALDLVAVTVGPGSFTGIRAGLSLAHGIALAAGVPVIGVTVGEALAGGLPHIGRRHLWAAIDTRRGRVFLERGGVLAACALEDLPAAGAPVAVAGDAAVAVAARLAARGDDVMLTDARWPLPRHVAAAAAARHRGTLPPLAPQPLYIDPPEARPPARGLRPPPQAT